MQHVGTYIAARRRALGLTQPELAEQIGMSEEIVRAWERGKHEPKIGMMRRVLRAIGGSWEDDADGDDALHLAALRDVARPLRLTPNEHRRAALARWRRAVSSVQPSAAAKSTARARGTLSAATSSPRAVMSARAACWSASERSRVLAGILPLPIHLISVVGAGVLVRAAPLDLQTQRSQLVHDAPVVAVGAGSAELDQLPPVLCGQGGGNVGGLGLSGGLRHLAVQAASLVKNRLPLGADVVRALGVTEDVGKARRCQAVSTNYADSSTERLCCLSTRYANQPFDRSHTREQCYGRQADDRAAQAGA